MGLEYLDCWLVVKPFLNLEIKKNCNKCAEMELNELSWKNKSASFWRYDLALGEAHLAATFTFTSTTTIASSIYTPRAHGAGYIYSHILSGL